MARYEDRYGRGSQRRDRGYADDRGYMDRASDEVRSWFGDDEAERRRHMDEQRDRERDPGSGMESGRGEWSRAEWPRGDEPRGDWDRSDYRQTAWDRRPDNRSESWRGRSSADRARYEDRSRPWAASDWDRERSMRDDEWPNREAGWDARPNRSTWSTDDGRMEFGAPASRSAAFRGGEQRWGRGPKGYQRSDARIHEEVCDRLTYSNVDAENLEITVANGEVTLSGSVRDRWDKRRAEDLAEEVAGVRDVHNNIRVHRPERGIGQSESSASDQPGSVLGVNPTAEPSNTGRRS